MKPNWDDAPDWATYLAMDQDGSWWWWKEKPSCGRFGWYNLYCHHELAGISSFRDTLEGRPSEQNEERQTDVR